MIRIIHATINLFIILLGIFHSSLTFTGLGLNRYTLWFFGSGIAIMLTGSINWLVLSTDLAQIRETGIIVNLAMTAFFGFALFNMRGLEVYTGIILFSLASLMVFLKKERTQHGNSH